ncbi:MAG: Rne/Rng family ribonuclease [Alphaproteobacteria bacterium]
MSKRMLIDASHPEETRVVVLDGNKVEEFDFESATRRPLKGNIYLAKVTRVEPSLQAAFVEYGGNRQGFLAFPEIHPDYYQIPVADRQALIAQQQEDARRMSEEDEGFEHVDIATVPTQQPVPVAGTEAEHAVRVKESAANDQPVPRVPQDAVKEIAPDDSVTEPPEEEHTAHDEPGPEPIFAENEPIDIEVREEPQPEPGIRTEQPHPRPRRLRRYKIQEVIKRRQIMLVQVVKEERGTKGAALTTYLSLAGRYCVLMPNTPRGGGISRKITSATDRKRLKTAAQSLELPEGMGLIIRTAGANRTKLEIKRDFEYLLRLWDTVRELTLKSNAPALVYEEGNLIKRAIRDLYNKEIGEVVVEGEAGYRDAKDFMRMIMPSHAKNVKLYKEPLPLFQRFHVETQLDAMFSPTVTLKSGGYVVINQTEALVSIDVNSGKATREHSIEDTAYKTNLEAADEIARQLRLRDLAGLIVIDFIDMEDQRNDRNVEKRLRDAVRTDRARVQIGKISQFGLLEMSRQRLRPGVVASSTVTCPHCGGTGLVRSTESAALRLLRALEEEGQNQRSSHLSVKAPADVVIYTLNQKRREIARIEEGYDLSIAFEPQANMIGGAFEIDRIGARIGPPRPRPAAVSVEAGFPAPTVEIGPAAPEEAEEEVELEAVEDSIAMPRPTQQSQTPPHPSGEEGGRRRRRRRRRGGRGLHPEEAPAQAGEVPAQAEHEPFWRPHADLSPEQHAQMQKQHHTQQSQTGQQQHVPHRQSESGQGGRRRRRRRGRRGRGRHGEGFSQGHQGFTEPRPSQNTDTTTFEQAPNAPSKPEWSLGSTQREPALREKEAHTQPERRDKTPEHVSQTAEQQADEPIERRKGWWQRNFKIGG